MPREGTKSRANGRGDELLKLAKLMRRRRKELVALEAEYESLLDDVERSAAENDAGTDRLLDDINAAPGDGWSYASTKPPCGRVVAALCAAGDVHVAWWSEMNDEWRSIVEPYEIQSPIIAWNENPRAPLPTGRSGIPHAVRAADSDAAYADAPGVDWPGNLIGKRAAEEDDGDHIAVTERPDRFEQQ